MGIFGKLLGRKKEEKEEVEVEETPEESLPEIIEEDTLDLGWYWSENQKRVADGKN
jgi:hypothetical protein